MRTDRVISSSPRALVVAALFGALLAGCDSGGGSSDEDDYFLRFEANGSRISYTRQSSLWASFGQSGSQYTAVFTGFDSDSNAGLQVYSNAPIEEGTYSGYEVSGAALVGVLIHYQDPDGVLYTSGGGPPAAATRITVEQITPTTVSGTFEGRLTVTGKPDLVVTDGTFRVQRTN